MNKQELIRKYEYMNRNLEMWVCTSEILKDLKQLDEPQKPVVPQFVADWIERSKQENRNLRNALNNGGEKMRLWFLDQENYDLFARAWLDGYEVEKEKRYLVKIKGLFNNLSYLNYDSIDCEWYFNDADNGDAVGTYHTKKQLEDAGFGDVFNSPLFEVKEVKE